MINSFPPAIDTAELYNNIYCDNDSKIITYVNEKNNISKKQIVDDICVKVW